MHQILAAAIRLGKGIVPDLGLGIAEASRYSALSIANLAHTEMCAEPLFQCRLRTTGKFRNYTHSRLATSLQLALFFRNCSNPASLQQVY